MSAEADSKLTNQARTFEVVAYLAAGTLGVQVLAMLEILSLLSPAADALLHGQWAAFWEAAQPMLLRLVNFLPVLCYLGGVIAAARIFGRVAGGELFSPANSKGLADVGSSLLWGAAAAALIVPLLLGAIDGEAGFRGLRMEPETWVIAVVGGAILVLGRMMAAAQVENAALKAELSDFV